MKNDRFHGRKVYPYMKAGAARFVIVDSLIFEPGVANPKYEIKRDQIFEAHTASALPAFGILGFRIHEPGRLEQPVFVIV